MEKTNKINRIKRKIKTAVVGLTCLASVGFTSKLKAETGVEAQLKGSTIGNSQLINTDKMRYIWENENGRVIYEDNLNGANDKFGIKGKVANVKNYDVSIFTTLIGNLKRNNCYDIGAVASRKFENVRGLGNLELVLDAEVLLQNKEKPDYFPFVGIYADKFSLEACAVSDIKNPIFPVKRNAFGWLALQPVNQIYLSGGYGTDDKIHGHLGLTNLKGINNFTFAMYDPDNNSWRIKSQFGITNPDKKFFDRANYDFGSSLLTIGSWFPKHLGPFVTKGNLTAMVDASGDSKSNKYDIGLGKDFGFAKVGAGLSTSHINGKRDNGIFVNAFRILDVKGIKAVLEGSYNSRSNEVSGYVTLK